MCVCVCDPTHTHTHKPQTRNQVVTFARGPTPHRPGTASPVRGPNHLGEEDEPLVLVEKVGVGAQVARLQPQVEPPKVAARRAEHRLEAAAAHRAVRH
eukprot:5595968-Prymnesium_polylepis.1